MSLDLFSFLVGMAVMGLLFLGVMGALVWQAHRPIRRMRAMRYHVIDRIDGRGKRERRLHPSALPTMGVESQPWRWN